jgi:hypothetical protein
MATRKQRRRREKEQRHEYEIVEIDGEGNETVVSPSELRPDNGAGKRSTPDKKGSSLGRGRGPMQPPSWNKVLKRGALFAPVFFATVLLLNGNKGYPVAIGNTILLLAVFIPFSYFMDRFFWRSQQKRMGKTPGA